MYLASSNYGSGGRYTEIWIDTVPAELIIYGGTYNISSTSITLDMRSKRAFRDVGAWYHLVLAVDLTDATESNRVKVYINGTLEPHSDFTNYAGGGVGIPAQGDTTFFNTTTQPVSIGSSNSSGGGAWAGYVAETVLIDGTQYAASDFGEFDSDSPTIWKPKDVSELTFGTNGFYLDFEDSADLGNDVSGESNDLTVVNLVAADQSQDTPVNNFATWNSLWVPADTLPTFYQGNTVVFTQDGSGKYFGAASTLGMTAGKWYAEFDPYQDVTVSVPGVIGIGGDISENVVSTDNFLGSEPYNYAYISDGTKVNNGSYSSYGDTYTDGDIIGVAVDFDNLKIYFAKNGVWQDSGDPTSGATGTGAAFTITAAASMTFPQDGAYFFACSDLGTGYVRIAANFGNGCFNNTVVTSSAADGNGYGLFEYAPPSGYLALCTKNLGSDGG
jgi:hypothetical protein